MAAPPPQDPEEDAADADDTGSDAREVELRAFTFGAAQHRMRLDQALAQCVPEFSRSYLRQRIEAGAVRIGGVVASRPSLRVEAGAGGAIELVATPQSEAFRPEAMALAVVFEDEHLLVIDKPAGLVVHPAAGNWSGTLLNGLLARDRNATLLPRAGIVHRLDKDTSGLMVVARTRRAMDALVQAIAARSVTRQYLALAQRGWSGPAVRVVEAPIGRDARNRLRMAVVAAGSGKPARTTVELLSGNPQACWLRCTLDTGRTHQIRVHLASIGHPIVGDTTYGGQAVGSMRRQALHAFRLALVHPVSGEALEWHAPLPGDVAQAAEALGLPFRPPG